MIGLPPPVARLIPVLAAVALLAPRGWAADPPVKVDFNRDVRPILADRCFACHGPDEKKRKAKFRLDTRDGLLGETSGGRGVVPGQPGKSEVISRITAADPAEVMPPPASGKKLSPAQIAILKAWVNQGAAWSGHWAFTRPVRPDVPKTRHPATNPIDAFVFARLEAAGLSPSPLADRVTLIRRVTLDLTGLPPTPEEVDAFVKDSSPTAYDKVVDRLLASPRYGERMAWRWLEAARYADTNGYQTDAGRDMWRWRDWVIAAYNRNLSFDRFTVEQLAGDLLPSPTLDQRIATGFNRNHRGNAEGGIVPEEYAVEYVADRVETTATVWLGLTLGCSRCHDHKFDPFTQKEFYRLFAYFNNVPEKGRAVKFGNSPPVIKAPTPGQQRQLAELDRRFREAGRTLAGLQGKIAEAQRRWENEAIPSRLPDWSPGRGLLARWSFPRAADCDGTRFYDFGNVGSFGFDDRFTLACRINPRRPTGAIVSRMAEEPQATGYSVRLVGGKLQVHLTVRWLDDALRVETLAAVPLNRWSHVAVSYDASRLAAGVRVYIDGAEVKTRVLLDELNQSFDTKEPLRVGSGGGTGTRFDGLIDDVRVYDRVLDPAEARVLAVAASPAEILAKRDERRTAAGREKLRAFFLEVAGPPHLREAHAAVRVLREEWRRFHGAIPTVMVMEEMPTPRDAHVLIRGQYDRKGEKVTPGVPAALGGTAAGNRLNLAHWLVSPDHPLTARVAVNRAWQLHFGTGLVKTTEDFGTQGAFPTHPDLLDWLACEFIAPASGRRQPAVLPTDHGQPTDAGRSPDSPGAWDLKRLHRLIVTSATYRQSSRVTKTALAEDPENHLLGRFPRLRLSPEMVRDQALFAGGLLVERVGGPSARPYQPPGLWAELSGAADYVPDTGDGLYRRSLYTYWKRTAPPPVMATFDAAGRETCWVRETRTNTPLQALTLLNETGFVEASRALAQRVMREGSTPDARLARAFRRVTGRTPGEAELRVLRRGLEFHLAHYRAHPDAARKLLRVGESTPDPALDPAELAAYAVICGEILNLDEAVTKE